MMWGSLINARDLDHLLSSGLVANFRAWIEIAAQASSERMQRSRVVL
jgi:hypothetical protein